MHIAQIMLKILMKTPKIKFNKLHPQKLERYIQKYLKTLLILHSLTNSLLMKQAKINICLQRYRLFINLMKDTYVFIKAIKSTKLYNLSINSYKTL